MSVQTRVPTSDAFFQEWTPQHGGTFTDELDDAVGTPDDDASYVETSTDGLACSFHFTAFELPETVTISSVDYVVRAKLTTGTGNLRVFGLVDGSATFTPDSPITVNGATYTDYTASFSTNPATGLAWTKADVEGSSFLPLGAQFGFFAHNLSGTMRVTQAFASVSYTTGGGSEDTTQTRPPLADAFFQEWTPLGGGSRTAEIDDPTDTPDDDTTYVETSTSGLACSFTTATFSLPASSSVTSVQIVVRAKLTTGTGNLRMFAPVDGSATFTPDSPITVNAGGYAEYAGTFSTNPATGIAWTQADVEGTGPKPLGNQFGFYSHNLSGTLRVTQAYLSVTYEPGGGGFSGGSGGITNRDVYELPALPSIGVAGSAPWIDPIFGTRNARVTDEDFTTDLGTSDRSFSTCSAGYQREWNADGTKFFVVAGDGNHYLVSFDRTTMATARLGNAALPFGREPGHWDDSNPNVLYGVGTAANHHTIVKVDVTNIPWTTTTLVDLDDIRSGLGDSYVGALHVANGCMALSYGGYSQEEHRYQLWFPIGNIAARKEIDTVTLDGMDEFNSHFSTHSAQLDMSGRHWNMVRTGSVVDGRPVAPYSNYFWDTTLNTVTPCREHSGGHEVLGWNARINADCLGSFDAIQWILTPDLTAVNDNRIELVTPLVTPQEIYAAEHSSWHNATAGARQPFISAIYRYYDGPQFYEPPATTIYGELGTAPAGYSGPANTVAWRCYDGEIVMVDTTEAGGTIRRLCHHRTRVYPDTTTAPFTFHYTPRANIDPTGRYVLYTSNMDKTLGLDAGVADTHRVDVFVLDTAGASVLTVGTIGEGGASLGGSRF